jgi:hypothetical protein
MLIFLLLLLFLSFLLNVYFGISWKIMKDEKEYWFAETARANARSLGLLIEKGTKDWK